MCIVQSLWYLETSKQRQYFNIIAKTLEFLGDSQIKIIIDKS